MAINPALLIAAPMLQDYLVDKDTGMPLANGIVSLYSDVSRSFYKNWYYQTGSPGAYSWVPLDNPLHLSSVGTIQDPNGNDVIPFYYPFQENDENEPEAYYVTVYSSDENGEPAVSQFTRENFPYVSSETNPDAIISTDRNYILNNIYWRNVGSQNLTNVTDMVIAPSQHEGYTNGDIRFLKSVNGASDSIAFLPMTQTLENDISPEYYLNMQCTALQAGETQKCIQYPISLHVNTLQNVNASLVFHAQNVSGNTNNFLNLYIYQFLGTGALSQPMPILIGGQQITLNNNWQKFVIPFTFPSSANLSLGSGGDDALFFQVQFPLSSVFQINHTKPQIYLSDVVPTNDFDTYDQVETIINSRRTGDIRISLSDYFHDGEVAANNGTIGNASSNATARANIDTWPLFNLMWQKFNAYNSGTSNPLAQMVSSTGSNVTYGASAIIDFNLNNAITLSKTMAQVLLGTVPPSALLTTYKTTFTGSNSGSILSITTANNVNYFNGLPISFSNTGGALPTGLSANTIYYVAAFNGTNNFGVATTFANAMAGSIIAYTDNGSGTNTVTSQLAGTFEGEYSHTLLRSQLPNPLTSTAGVTNCQSGGSGVIHADGSTGDGIIGNGGGGNPFNITQPGTFMNFYFKL